VSAPEAEHQAGTSHVGADRIRSVLTRLRRVDPRLYVVYVAFLLILVFFAVTLRDDGFLSQTNLLNIVRQTTPVTVMAVVAGVALGARAGFAVGATAAFVSNFFLGQGVWTPWQMLGWGACGVAGALAAPLLRSRVALAAFCFVLGMGFSAFMDVWNWLAFYDEHTWQTFVAVHARGLPFDLAHAIGNVVIALVAGPELRRLLDRYGRRLNAEVVWA